MSDEVIIPSLFLFLLPYEKSGQHLLRVVSLQLSTAAALAIYYYHSIETAFLKVTYNHLIAKTTACFQSFSLFGREQLLLLRKAITTSFLTLKPALDSSIVFWLHTYLPEVHCAVENAHTLASDKGLSSRSVSFLCEWDTTTDLTNVGII